MRGFLPCVLLHIVLVFSRVLDVAAIVGFCLDGLLCRIICFRRFLFTMSDLLYQQVKVEYVSPAGLLQSLLVPE